MDKAKIGDKIKLSNQEVEVVKSDVTGDPMVNVSLDHLSKGDLALLKSKGVGISDKNVAGNVAIHETLGHKIASWFEGSDDEDSEEGSDDSDDDDDDSHFFHSSGSFLGGSSFGGSGGGGFGGGFGGFGGGGFAGGGASAGF